MNPVFGLQAHPRTQPTASAEEYNEPAPGGMNRMYCDQCGKAMSPNARYCRACGIAISERPPVLVPSPDEPAAIVDSDTRARDERLSQFRFRMIGACDQCGYSGPFGWNRYHYKHFNRKLMLALFLLGVAPVVPLLLITLARKRYHAMCPNCGTWILLRKHTPPVKRHLQCC
jgi:predicted RNA-binding Zn-ribbon protein involved in translation (DUF1610 family)